MTDIDLQALRDFMATEVMGFIIHPKLPYSWVKGGNPVCDIDQWIPDLDSNQLDMLIDKMVEDIWNFRLYCAHNGVVVARFWFIDGSSRLIEAKSDNPDRRLAVLLAIKAAKEAK